MPKTSSRERVIVLVGPQSSGKTALVEAILRQTGKLEKGQPGARLFGDTSSEAKAREMGTEVNIASTTFMGDRYSFVDCPGAIELMQESRSALTGADAAIIVTEPDPEKFVALMPLLKYLEEINCPRYIFVNKLDRAGGSVQDLVSSLSTIVSQPIILRHIPTFENDRVNGYVDLASERAYVYKEDGPSEVIALAENDNDATSEARYSMLEALADFDDHLMEELLEDITPPKDEVYGDLTREVQEGLIIPVLLGSAIHQNGVHRLLKALRHEVPDVSSAQRRLHVDTQAEGGLGVVLKTIHTSHAGKLSVARILNGRFGDGDTINGQRISGISRLHGDKLEKLSEAVAGDLVGLGRLETVHTGDTIFSAKQGAQELVRAEIATPVYTLALNATDRSEEVKMSNALTKVCDEDPSLRIEHVQDTGQTLLEGQGEIHLQITIDRLSNKYGLNVSTDLPRVPYKETIRKSTSHHSRYKKQSGGHGQYGDVVIQVTPLPSGSGFSFNDTITGGAIPKQYIPSVEHGIREYLVKGPLGFPVVDVGVTLTDGGFHAVDSSDMAFKTAGRMAISEALPECTPVLLEPIMHVHILVPSENTAKVNALISSRRGQILGFDARNNWDHWDDVEAYLPQSEMQDLIIELRSMTMGAGTYTCGFDHLSELTGRLADQVMTKRAAAE